MDEQAREFFYIDRVQCWKPLRDLPNIVSCEAIIDDYEWFRIFLRGYETEDRRFIRLKFEEDFAYRKLDEGDSRRTFALLTQNERGIFFVAERSSFIDWFHAESFSIRQTTTLLHYIVFAVNDTVEVLASEPPVVEWVDSVS
jgi:hypothetical protein